jgi:hypothetical protein
MNNNIQLITITLVIVLSFVGSYTFTIYGLLTGKTKKFNFGRVFVGWFTGVLIFFISSLIYKEAQSNINYVIVISSLGGVFGYSFFGFILQKKILKTIFNRFIFIVSGVNIDKEKDKKQNDKD